MPSRRVITASRVPSQVKSHVQFLLNVSIRAAKAFRNDLNKTLIEIQSNPFQFPYDTAFDDEDLKYRKAVFSKRYKILFFVENDDIHIDAVVDCRQSMENYW